MRFLLASRLPFIAARLQPQAARSARADKPQRKVGKDEEREQYEEKNSIPERGPIWSLIDEAFMSYRGSRCRNGCGCGYQPNSIAMDFGPFTSLRILQWIT